jgi:hypothetical protein
MLVHSVYVDCINTKYVNQLANQPNNQPNVAYYIAYTSETRVNYSKT